VIPWITYSDAITEALRVEMRRDPTVLCLGRVAENGKGRPTDGLAREFGPSRVSEHEGSSILAAAAAAASEGMRPVCELTSGDLGQDGGEKLREAAASGALVVRLIGHHRADDPAVGGVSLGEIPELKVVSPATAADAKGLLVSAIRDEDPVCFLEWPDLYTTVRDGVPEGAHVTALGEARLVRPGTEMVVLTHGAGAVAAEQAANAMRGEVGIVDLRTLRPLDRDAVTATVRETGKVLIAERRDLSTGFAEALVELIYEEASEYLDAPIREHPASAADAAASGQQAEGLEEAYRELVAF
jgi:pyruvate/2-oxoglutarate/acetoin dehydrogenase E1 component